MATPPRPYASAMPPAASTAREQANLLALFTAIAQRDHSVIQRMLVTTPAIAHVAASSGATRQDPKRYFFESIARYAYAGTRHCPSPWRLTTPSSRRNCSQ